MYGTTSTIAATVDNVFYYILGVSVFFLLLITGLIIYFSIRYRRSRHPEAVQIEGSVWLEVTWTVIPLILVLSMFWFGFEGFRAMRDVPEDAMTVQVTGRMWDWSFRYENGRESDRLYVPVGQAVKLAMTSVDVLHSFFIPAFRIKEDVVPGRETYLWFKPRTTGTADVFCAEFCGTRHSYMMTEVVVLEEGEFRAWLASGETSSDEGPGPVVVMDRHGCLLCHSLDGTYDTGPTFKGLYGSVRTVMREGERIEVVADDDYLRRAILEPVDDFLPGLAGVSNPAR